MFIECKIYRYSTPSHYSMKSKKYIEISILVFAVLLVLLVIVKMVNKPGSNFSSTTSNTIPTLSPVILVTPTPIPQFTPTPLINSKSTLVSAKDNQFFYANINKTYALPSTFAPNDLISVSSTYAPGQYMRKEAAEKFNQMAEAAKSDSIDVKGVSGYRSYSTQNQIFNGYVKNEESNGLSYDAAIIKANTYSAVPGHSEHQLGNTIDILSKSDSDFNFTDSNKKVWQWMAENAYKYGFVVSYPTGKTNFTGYNAEPWHVRYFGLDFASNIMSLNYLSTDNNITTQSQLSKIADLDGLSKTN